MKAEVCLLEPRTKSSHRGCGWIQVIQDRLFPSVRPILDYLFLEAADGPPPESEMAPGTWYMHFFLSSGLRLGPLNQQNTGKGMMLAWARVEGSSTLAQEMGMGELTCLLLSVSVVKETNTCSFCLRGHLQQATLLLLRYMCSRGLTWTSS